MGTYTAGEFLETFGGLPERGECIPDFDAIRDRDRELRMEADLRAEERQEIAAEKEANR